MSAPTNMGERMMAVETKLDIVIDNQKSMNEKLDLALPTFVTKEQHIADIKELNRKRWAQNTLSAIAGAALALLITYAFSQITK